MKIACGVFRDHLGHSVLSFIAPLSVKYAFEAKLSAVIIAINRVVDLRPPGLWIECDSSYVVKLLQSNNPNVPWYFHKEWQTCLNKLNSMQVYISHIFREGNAVADKLSLIGLSLTQIRWWSNHPSDCNDLIMRDILGKENYRLSP